MYCCFSTKINTFLLYSEFSPWNVGCLRLPLQYRSGGRVTMGGWPLWCRYFLHSKRNHICWAGHFPRLELPSSKSTTRRHHCSPPLWPGTLPWSRTRSLFSLNGFGWDIPSAWVTGCKDWLRWNEALYNGSPKNYCNDNGLCLAGAANVRLI